jgi:uncharacterized protein
MNSNHPFTSRRRFLRSALVSTGLLAPSWISLRQAFAQNTAPSDQEKIEAAIPARAPTRPRRPRKLLIFTLNVNYGGHPSIATASQAFTLMGHKTGAFETVVSRDPAIFQRESLQHFDAIFFNNTVGNLFTDPVLRQNIADFVYAGGGLMGVHGTSVAFTQWPGASEDWPEFGLMLGARGANHRASDEHVFIKLDDATHPVNAPFHGQGFDYRDEFFRVHDPYSRQKLRVLFSIDVEKTDLKQGPGYGKLERADKDFALAWVRQYGRGRSFYCTIAHNPRVFWDSKMLEFYLAAAQFVLGDLAAPTTPSARLTPAVQAQERLGWRVGLSHLSLPKPSVFDLAAKASGLGLGYAGASDQMPVSAQAPQSFDYQLGDDDLRAIRLKLDEAGVRLLTYQVRDLPADAGACRRIFEFSRKMGVETIICSPPRKALDDLAQLCDEFDLRLALASAGGKDASPYGRPEDILKVCQGRTPRLGACANFDAWLRQGIAPLEALEQLKERALTLQLDDLSQASASGRPIPWGTGAARLGDCLAAVQRLGLTPTMLGTGDCSPEADRPAPLADAVQFLNQAALDLAKRPTQ